MKKIINIFKISDLRKKLAFTASLLLVYRLGGKVPVPGINKSALKAFMDGATQQNSLLGLYDTFVGGFFSQASIFTLGIMPYISASIIIGHPLPRDPMTRLRLYSIMYLQEDLFSGL